MELLLNSPNEAMSRSKKRPRAAPVSAEKCQQPKIDEDFLCLICKELVICAKQVDCCGGLFCGECIYIWLNKEADGDQVCPSCRVVLKECNIFSDLKSDRKSAEQPRRCPFHDMQNCEFIGTRQEVAFHKIDCPCDPDRCTSQRCKAEKAKLKTQQAEEAKKICEKSAAAATKAAFVNAALLSPEENLKRAYGFSGAKLFSVEEEGIYTIEVRDAAQPSLDFDIVCVEANYNVSLFFSRPSGSVAPPGGFPKLKIDSTLISFDPSVIEDEEDETELESDFPIEEAWGITNWMTSEKFEKFAKDGKFAFGWKMTVVV